MEFIGAGQALVYHTNGGNPLQNCTVMPLIENFYELLHLEAFQPA